LFLPFFLLAALPARSLLIRSAQTSAQWNNRPRRAIGVQPVERNQGLLKRRGGNAWRKRQLHGGRASARARARRPCPYQRSANSPCRSGSHDLKTPHATPKSQPKLKIQSAEYRPRSMSFF
jgi:hypothetical protein